MPNDGHEIATLDPQEVDEAVLNTPTAICTYGMGPDVTLTVGNHVAIKLNMAEAVNLITDLRRAVEDVTKSMEVFEQYYDKLHQ